VVAAKPGADILASATGVWAVEYTLRVLARAFRALPLAWIGRLRRGSTDYAASYRVAGW
jgi:hypothetical protein